MDANGEMESPFECHQCEFKVPAHKANTATHFDVIDHLLLHANDGWCEVDECPSAICNGPHVAHICSDGARVDQRYDNPEPCPFGCGWKPATGRQP